MYYLCTSVGFCGLTLLHIFSITPHVFLPPCLTTLVGQNAAGLVVDVLGSGSQETHRKRARLWKYVEVFGWEWGTPPKIMFQSIVLKRKLMTQPRPTHLPFLPSFTFFLVDTQAITGALNCETCWNHNAMRPAHFWYCTTITYYSLSLSLYRHLGRSEVKLKAFRYYPLVMTNIAVENHHFSERYIISLDGAMASSSQTVSFPQAKSHFIPFNWSLTPLYRMKSLLVHGTTTIFLGKPMVFKPCAIANSTCLSTISPPAPSHAWVRSSWHPPIGRWSHPALRRRGVPGFFCAASYRDRHRYG